MKILTFNCEGLGDYKRGSDVLNYLYDKNHNIYFLQDTHFTSDEEQNIQIFWGGKTYSVLSDQILVKKQYYLKITYLT